MASGYQPTTYSYQKSLPHLPVPPLNQTIDRFLLSMEPLYGADSEQFKKLCTSAQVCVCGLLVFYRAACNADAVLRGDFCPSVRLSVCHTRVL